MSTRQNPKPKPQPIEYSNASCGAGKTEWAVNFMARNRGRYVYAVDRIEEFDSRKQRIYDAASKVSTAPFVGTLQSLYRRSVAQGFKENVEAFGQLNHTILIITHAALKLVDHDLAEGWILIIDEDLKLWSSDVIDISASKPYWRETYNLTPIEGLDGYSTIRQKTDAPSFAEVARDALTTSISSLHDRIKRTNVTVKLTSWDDLNDRLTWFSIFDVTELRGYARIIILANSFDQLLSFRLIQTTAPDVELRPLRITRRQEWLPRDVMINYVATCHTATTNHLANTSEGQTIVREWSKWAASLVDTTKHYWCANKSFPAELPGHRVSSKIAGSNAYSDLTQCSIIYAAKASTNEARVFEDLAGGAVSFDDIRRDREFEDLIQIVFRSSLRTPGDTRPVTINLYDREQAEFIREYFIAAGFPFEIMLQHHDIGAVKTQRKRGPKIDPAKPRKTAAERSKAYRERQAQKKKANQALNCGVVSKPRAA